MPENVLEQLVSLLDRSIPGHEWASVLETLSEQSNHPPRLLMVRAMMNWRAGHDDPAIELCTQIVERAPESQDLIYRCAALAHTVDRLDEARRWLDHLLALNPQHLDGLFLLGRIRANEGAEDEAKETLSRVIDLKPNHFLALYELGRLENRSANSEAAEDYLGRAVKAFPFFKEAYNALLIALARQRKDDDVKETRAVVQYLNQWSNEKENRMQYAFRNPGLIPPDLGYEMAVELHTIGRRDLAKTFLRGTRQRDRMNDSQRLLLAQYEFRDEQFTEAYELLGVIEAPRLKTSETFTELQAWLLYSLNREDEAKIAVVGGLEKFPESVQLLRLQETMNTTKEEQAPEVAEPAEFRFVDVSEAAGITAFTHRIGHPDKRWITDAMGSGVAVGDYDNDGDDDLYFVNARPDLFEEHPDYKNRLFRNDDGTFTDVTAEAGVGDTGFGMAAIFGDVNNDGLIDLYVANYGPNQLYQNNGDGTFINATDASGADDAGYAAAAAFGDVDADGDLDLFIGNYVDFHPEQHSDFRDSYHGESVFAGPLQFTNQPHVLYKNDGTGRFENVSDEAGINISEGRAMGVVLVDLDLDGDLDLYVANDGTYNHVLLNNGDGTFEDISFLSGAGFNESGVEGASMGVAAGDFTNNGLPDLLVTAYEQQSDVLYENLGDGLFRDVSINTGIAKPTRMKITWGCGFVDFDADGWLDFYTANGHIYPQVDTMGLDVVYKQGLSFYRNTGTRFDLVDHTEKTKSLRVDNGRGSALLDYDRDGDLDVVVSTIDSTPQLIANETEGGTWLQVRLEGSSARVLGARIVARAGEQTWSRWVDGGSSYLSQNSQTVHFGFGTLDSIDELTVHWIGLEPTTHSIEELNREVRISAPK